jgi:deazaflavin-dependent oxidoreductase (nitroreductase family)
VTGVTGGHPETGLEEDLAAWGKVVVLETRGRRSGRLRRATVGFIEADDGSILVAAADEDVHWARNLTADPYCVVERDGERRTCRATSLDEHERQAVVASLIMRYGTPAERLGAGPAFRLTSAGHPDTPPRADDASRGR